MDLTRLTRDADDLIRKVVSRYNQLYIPSGTISQVELDLMLDDLRKLYDTFKIIGTINLTLQNNADKPVVSVNTVMRSELINQASSTIESNEKPIEAREPMPAAKEPEAKPTYLPIVETDPEPENVTAFDKEPELISEPEAEPMPENPVFAQPDTYEPEKIISGSTEKNYYSPNTEPTSVTLADKFNTGNKSLSESMASTSAQGVMGSRLLFQPLSDLTTGIGLNDKFNFIGELFANNAVQYEEAITRINKAVNIDEANWILQKYHITDWEHKQDTVARLKDFVKRRFI